ncbi:MAG: hypothetical protein ACW9XH_06890 [Candidatus Nitrosopumilus sp. bin_32a]
MENSEKTSLPFYPYYYVQPQLDFEGYEFEWSDHSYGIKENEVNEFKHFMRNVIPVLPDCLRYIQALETIIEKKKNLDKFQLGGGGFTPTLDLGHSFRKGLSFTHFSIQFTWDGETFVDREENIVEKGQFHPVNLKWQVGQLYKKEDGSQG